MSGMTDYVHLALAGLALCDALDDGGVSAEARIKSVESARRHFRAVINRGGKARCVCPDESRGECDCRGECICTEVD